MKFISALVAFVFLIFFVLVAIVLIGIAFSPASADLIGDALAVTAGFMLKDLNARVITGIVGLLLIFLSVTPFRMIMGNFERDRSIAFNNPDGQVQIALTAIEDFIKRISYDMKDVKELKPKVSAGRKAVEIDNRVSFYAGTAIPEATQRIQAQIKNQVQDMLGVEQSIIVKVRVTKILKKDKSKPKEPEIDESPPIPYR